MQDIAGCRLVVADIVDQNPVVESLTKVFPNLTVVDRREVPSHGYRAVHVIVEVKDKLVEIQVRTSLQHLWAELSEKLSDVIDPAIKYGGGDESFVKLLASESELIDDVESGALLTANNIERLSRLVARHGNDLEKQKELIALEQEMRDIEKHQMTLRDRLFRRLRRSLDDLPMKGRNQ